MERGAPHPLPSDRRQRGIGGNGGFHGCIGHEHGSFNFSILPHLHHDLEGIQQIQVLFQAAGQQELSSHGLVGGGAQPLAQRLVPYDLDDPPGRFGNRRNQEPVDAVANLVANTADVAADSPSACATTSAGPSAGRPSAALTLVSHCTH